MGLLKLTEKDLENLQLQAFNDRGEWIDVDPSDLPIGTITRYLFKDTGLIMPNQSGGFASIVMLIEYTNDTEGKMSMMDIPSVDLRMPVTSELVN